MDPTLQNIDFEPLTEVKARLSEKIARVDRERRLLAITLNGKPKAIVLPYQDFLDWMQTRSPSEGKDEEPRRMSFTEWEKESLQRRAASEAIKNLFDLSRIKRDKRVPSYIKKPVKRPGGKV